VPIDSYKKYPFKSDSLHGVQADRLAAAAATVAKLQAGINGDEQTSQVNRFG